MIYGDRNEVSVLGWNRYKQVAGLSRSTHLDTSNWINAAFLYVACKEDIDWLRMKCQMINIGLVGLWF